MAALNPSFDATHIRIAAYRYAKEQRRQLARKATAIPAKLDDAAAVPPRIVLPTQGELPPCVDFLKKFHGDAPWHLVAIKCEDVKAYTLEGEKRETRAAEWIARWNEQGYAIYFHPNPLERKNCKANKADVARAEWLWADLDPPKKATPEEIAAWRAERLKDFAEGRPSGLPAPSWVIDSGRGFWCFWKLREAPPTDSEIVGKDDKGRPIIHDGPATRLIESYGRGIEQAFGGAADNCRNIDRIARLPGALNHKAGQSARALFHNPERAYALDDFPQGPVEKEPPSGNGHDHSPSPDFVAREFAEGEDLEDTLDAGIRGIIRDGVPEGDDRSKWFQICVNACRDAGLSAEQTFELLSRYPRGIAEKYWARGDLEKQTNASWTKAGPWLASRAKGNGEGERLDPETGEILGEKPQVEAEADPCADFIFDGEAVIAPSRALVKGLVPYDGICFIGGQSGAGKTFKPPSRADALRMRSPTNRSKVTNGVKLLPGVDGRNTWARRFYDLCASHAQDAGGPDTLSEAQISLIRRAAALEVTLENLEQAMAEGREVDLDQYSRSAGHLRRILETVGVRKVAKNVTPVSLADLVKQHRAAEGVGRAEASSKPPIATAPDEPTSDGPRAAGGADPDEPGDEPSAPCMEAAE